LIIARHRASRCNRFDVLIRHLQPATSKRTRRALWIAETVTNKWVFPNGITLPKGQTLLVWASNKNRGGVGQPLHTNFVLNAGNNGVGVVNPQGVLVDSHRWTTPQVEDRSAGWGIDNFTASADGKTRKLRFFGFPTPGTLNIERAYTGLCAPVAFSSIGGVFSVPQSFSVTLTAPAATVRYTTDFSVPTETSPAYTSPIPVTTTAIIRAGAFAAGCLPSPVVTHSYLYKQKVLGNASSGTPPTDHQQKPAGWSDATDAPPLLIDYAMDPVVIAANKTALVNQLTAIPTLSIATGQWDVLTQSGPENGDTVAYDWLKNMAADAAADPTNATKWTKVTDLLNPDNFIDYMLVNLFANNTDWPDNNWRAARRKDLDIVNQGGIIYSPTQKFRFFIWDAEIAMTPGDANSLLQNLNAGAARLHTILLAHPSYKTAWKARTAIHFGTAGVFSLNAGVHGAAMRFQTEANLFDAVTILESARWGDARTQPAVSQADWLNDVNDVKNTWLAARRMFMIDYLKHPNRALMD